MIGIDPGLHGAIAFYTPTDLIVWDMPLVLASAQRHMEIDGRKVAEIFRGCGDCAIIIEEVHSMPDQGVASMFSFGLNYGRIIGVAQAQLRKIYFIRPAIWKSLLNLSSDKSASLELALKTFPKHTHMFSRKKDDGRAEAALLAKLGHDRFNLRSQV